MDGPPEDAAEDSDAVELAIGGEAAGARLDKALADAAAAAGLPELSRSRLARLIAAGAVADPGGGTVAEPRRKVKPGERYTVAVPPPLPAEPEPEAIPLEIVHEDADIVVVNKPAGMVVHPAPGAERGTLVNALLHHCGESLAGIGGARRPGIVHRIDKETSGLVVVAKTAAAHAGLAAQFAAHAIERRYLAVLAGIPDRAEPRLAGLPSVSFGAGGWIRIETMIARHPADRKRMAVSRRAGRRAVTHLRVAEPFRVGALALASLAECRLETGRTHQIRVHAAHVGHPLVGDPVYGRRRVLPAGAVPPDLAGALDNFCRQALHANTLGVHHPRSGAWLEFAAPPPRDFEDLVTSLRRNASTIR